MARISNQKKESSTHIDYAKIDQMESFNVFVQKKNKFLFGVAAAFLTFYILLPVLAFTTVLQQKWIGNITGVWIYSAALFVMTVSLAVIYSKMAPRFDKQAAAVLAEYMKDGAQ